MLKELKVDARIAPGDLERIPASGPVIAVSNHPFGILDGTLLTQVLTRVRADVRVLTNHFLGELPELAPYCIFIDPFDRPGSRMTNGRALKQAIAHVRARGLLLIFPAGEVAHFDLKTRAIRDPEWMPTAARLIRLTGARALPIRVRGANGLGFQVLGMVHPRLRTAALPTELLNKRGKSVDILVGSPIESARLEAIPEDAEAIQYLRLRSELLARRGEAALVALPVSAPVSEAIPAGDLEREIQLLPTETLLEQNRDYCVYVSGAAQIPLVLREIGRLREITFRAAGEGSGLARDLDRFDPHYFHLFIWNRSRRELWAPIGSATCRGCSTNSDARGSIRLRCSGFTRCFCEAGAGARIGPILRPAGVSEAVRAASAALERHWSLRPPPSAICDADRCGEREQPVFGGVEGSDRALFRDAEEGGKSEGAVPARQRLAAAAAEGQDDTRLGSEGALRTAAHAEDLSGPIADLEPDGEGIPILVRQYVKLGGKLLAFSVDPTFGNTLDGFVLVNLTQTNPEMLARYMGKEPAAAFFRWHSAAARPRVA